MEEIFNTWCTLSLVSHVTAVTLDRKVHSRIERNFLVAQGHQGPLSFPIFSFRIDNNFLWNLLHNRLVSSVSLDESPFVDVSGENNTDDPSSIRRFLLLSRLLILSHQYWWIEIIFRGGVSSSVEKKNKLVQSFEVQRVGNKLFVYPTFTSNI